MKLKVRILPAAIFMMLSLMAFKGASMANHDLAATTASELEKAAPAAGEEKKDEAKPEVKDTDKKDAKEADKKDDKKDGKDAAAADSTIRVYQDRPEEQASLKYTGAEKDLLTKLADRRRELDKFQGTLDLKANLLESTSKKLDEKLAKLQELKAATEKLLVTYKEQEDVKIKSLVKIYVSMKPKQAAAIFDKMDMAILLEIIDKMPEKKSALILAQMNPEKAKEITQELANQHSLASEMGVKDGAVDKLTN